MLIQGFAVLDAAAEKLRPRRHARLGIGLLRQEPPELRMMPAKLVSDAIAMLTDPGAKASHLRDKRISIETEKVLVQVVSSHPRILLLRRDHGK